MLAYLNIPQLARLEAIIFNITVTLVGNVNFVSVAPLSGPGHLFEWGECSD